ncbi:MAG TPA: pitrilysin family protein [Candidatus Acidoferrales bacterium]|nr:pitrilysin family protein [Candidatus Acidoferrales bacterium]
MSRSQIVLYPKLILSALLLSAAATAQTASQQKTPAPPAAPAAAQLNPQIPGAAQPKSYKFPPVASRTLANGMRVFVVSSSTMPAVTARLILTAAGSVNDPHGKPGIAAMTASLLTQGTDKRTAQQIAEAIDFVGGSLSANAASDGTVISVTVVKKDFDLAMDLLADVTLHANFQPEEIERQRQQLLSGLQLNYQDADYLASAAFGRIVYGSHPYGLPGEGTPASAQAMTRDDFVRFRDTYYSPNTALLAFSGDISPDAAFAAAEKMFGAWQKKAVPVDDGAPPVTPPGVHITVIDKPDAVQTQIRVGKSAIRRTDPDYIPLYVSNRIFGGGYNSRLNTEVRVKSGLTYGANSGFDMRLLGGSFVASTSTRTEATVPALKLVTDLMKGMASKDVKPEELKFARDYLVGVYPIQTETTDSVADRVLMVAHYGLAADFNETYQSHIAAVTLDQVDAMAAKYFDPAALDVVLVGNAAQFRDALKKEFPSASYDEISAAELDLMQPGLHKYVEAVPAPTPESLARGKAMLADATQAAGGDALAKIQSMESSFSGHATMGQSEMPLNAKVVIVFPDRVRVDIKLPIGDLVQAYDGKNGWVQNPQGAAAVPPDQNTEFIRTILLAGGWELLREASAGKVQAQFLGDRDLMGQRAQAVSVNADGIQMIVYLDPSTHYLAGARFNQDTPQGKVETVELWSDYRDVQGLKFPYHTVTYRDGARFSESTTEDIKLNTSPEAHLFVKPQ